MAKENLIHLLELVKEIKNKHDEFAKLTGENFNFLRILNKENYENYHSAIISELLNEQGSHGQGNLFLKIFIDVVNPRIDKENKSRNLNNELNYFDKSISVTEKHTDKNDRIDVFIEDKNQVLIIENKIGAEDQKEQIKRYFDFASSLKKENDSSKKKEIIIFYLWKDYIDVNDPKKNNTFDNDKDVRDKTISISYKNEIKKWIELCIKECVNLPVIRETLNQYLNSVNTITSQATNNKMEQDIIDKIIKTGNVDTAIQISNSIEKIKSELCHSFLKKICNSLNTMEIGTEIKTKTNLCFDLNFDNSSKFYFELDFNEGIGISIINSSVLKEQRVKFLTHFKVENLENASNDNAYNNWLWYSRDWVKFNTNTLTNDEVIKQQTKLFNEMITNLKNIQL